MSIEADGVKEPKNISSRNNTVRSQVDNRVFDATQRNVQPSKSKSPKNVQHERPSNSAVSY